MGEQLIDYHKVITIEKIPLTTSKLQKKSSSRLCQPPEIQMDYAAHVECDAYGPN